MSPVPRAYYLVLDYGRAGRESVIDWENCSHRDVVDQIVRGDYRGKLIEVHAIDREDGTWRDVSVAVAEEVVRALDDYPRGDLREFLESILGFEALAEVDRQFMSEAEYQEEMAVF